MSVGQLSDMPDDPLEGNPPPPRLRDAAAAPVRPSQSSTDLASRAGADPEFNKATRVASNMMQLEQLVKELSKDVPQIIDIFAPVIQQMRTIGASVLANEQQGGLGSLDYGTGAPPPIPPGMGMPSGMGGGAGAQVPPGLPTQ